MTGSNGHNSYHFGRVFKVLWSKPTGSAGIDVLDEETLGTGGMHSKIRRLLVVVSRKGHSLCLPILTYRGQGVTKKGLHTKDHAVIYTDKTTGPALLPGEEKSPMRPPILMEPERRIDTLHKASRINYAKVYTIEHKAFTRVCSDPFM